MKGSIRRFLCALSVLLLAGCTVTGDRGRQTAAREQTTLPEAPPAQAGGKLTIYSALPEEELPVYLHAFTKDTGIETVCTRLSAGEMMLRAEAEREAPQASVLLGGSSDFYRYAAKSGLLEPYQSPELQNVQDAYRDPDGYWTPIYIGVIGFACNQEWFEENGRPYPRVWDDLLDPAFAGRIVMASPETSGTSYNVLAALVQKLGQAQAWEYFAALDQNIAYYTRSGLAPVEAVKKGEAAVGIVFSHDGRRAALDGYPVELCYPEDGTALEIGACALTCGGSQEETQNAKAFIDWMLSQRGQECFIEAKSCRLPVNAAARTADGLPAPGALNVIESDWEWAGAVQKELSREFCTRMERARTPVE